MGSITHSIASTLRKPQALVQEMAVRPPVIGKIRLGVQVLTTKGKSNPNVVRIYEDGVAAGLTFKAIEKKIESETGVERVMRPENTEHLSLTQSDFTDPKSVETLMALYGEDRGEGRKIYSLPVIFPFDDVLKVMPHRFAAYTASQLMYFSEYGGVDGQRYCMTYSKPVQSQVSSRVTRSFGGRLTETRSDEHIDGICDFERCPEFQNKKCSLDLNLLFMIPGMKGAGVVQAHSTSTIAMLQWYATLSLVMTSRGSLRNVEFRLTKKLMDTTYMNDKGVMEKSRNWITILTAAIELPKMMQEADQLVLENRSRFIGEANAAANLLEHPGTVSTTTDASSLRNQDERHQKLLQYIEGVRNSDRNELSKLLAELGAYVRYHNIERERLTFFAARKYGDEWQSSIDDVKALVGLVSTRTTTELDLILKNRCDA